MIPVTKTGLPTPQFPDRRQLAVLTKLAWLCDWTLQRAHGAVLVLAFGVKGSRCTQVSTTMTYPQEEVRTPCPKSLISDLGSLSCGVGLGVSIREHLMLGFPKPLLSDGPLLAKASWLIRFEHTC